MMRAMPQTWFMALAAVAALATTGCSGSIDEWWSGAAKTTVHWYDTYVNPPATVDYADVGDVQDYHRVIARCMAVSEMRLSALERFLWTNDSLPTEKTVEALKAQFPWLTGLAAVSPEGEILAREPAYDLKNLDFSKIIALHGDADKIRRDVVGMIHESPFGPEVMLGMPVYRDTDYLGMLVLHFDVRALFATNADAADLVITSAKGVLWPGRYVYDETPLASVDWASVLTKDVSGIVSNGHGSFFWLSRYVGKEPIVFAIRVKGAFPEDTSQVVHLLNINESK